MIRGILKNAKIRSIMVQLSLVVVSLVFLGILSDTMFGWFSENKRVENQNIDLRIDGDSIASISFDAYKRDSSTNLVTKLVGDDVVLPLYDSVLIDNNEFSSLIFRAPVFGKAISDEQAFTLSLDLKEASGVVPGSNNYRDNDLVDANNNQVQAIADYISNAVYIKAAIIPTSVIAINSDATTIYNYAHEFFADSNIANYQKETFFDVETANGVTTYTKKSSISFSFSDYDTPEEYPVEYVYLEIGYDVDLSQMLLDSRGLTLDVDTISIDNGGNTIDIYSDLNRFTFNIAD